MNSATNVKSCLLSAINNIPNKEATGHKKIIYLIAAGKTSSIPDYIADNPKFNEENDNISFHFIVIGDYGEIAFLSYPNKILLYRDIFDCLFLLLLYMP
ncbi:MAG: hypothetical protein OMM_13611 [Candidatus Magnetoglobus multicellularis str. Araruama]|uniref:Uncharacterized protein n=1 Tax=Candidatus Magnetoglobus multicellularis str. Araruama TaxID=890399 RepID=A0A1V1NTE4_9BACT|nr:MAG: hypothetical protein OMM_13611 [Candidatus Magnetoglobus multicellularis str. Araruama]